MEKDLLEPFCGIDINELPWLDLLMTKQVQPMDSTVFGDSVDSVELFGSTDSLVWSRNTLYTPIVRQPPKAGSNTKGREWVKWRPVGGLESTTHVPVLIRSKDWLQHVEKMKLTALTHAGSTQGGWRTFLIEKNEPEMIDAKRIKVTLPNGSESDLQSVLNKLL